MSGRTILIIDDDELIRELLCYNLEKEGYRVIAAKDGAQALDLLTREQPDLIILDLMLPGIDGLEVCRQIRFNTRFLEVPFDLV